MSARFPGLRPPPSLSIAVSPRIALAFVVVGGIALRLALVFERGLQRYLPDEYLYGMLARSIAEGRGARVLGMTNATPALLQPLATAPVWLARDPEVAFRLTQVINLVAMGLGAVAVYCIARELSVRQWSAVGAAGVAIASPDLLYSGYVTTDAIGSTLALLAILLGVRAIARPTLCRHGLFLLVAGLATFARLQYAALVIAAIFAAIVVERGRHGMVLRRHILLVGAPVALLVAIMAGGGLGRYASVTGFGASGDTLRWIPVSAALLAIAAGVIIVPGASVWCVSQFLRPTDRVRTAFAAFSASLIGVLIVASALFASETGSTRFFERYQMLGIPLAAIGFCCWVAEGRPLRNVALTLAATLIVIVARAPISEYAAAQGRADSPLLLAVSRLEGFLGVGTASLIVALAATMCAAIAGAAAFGWIGPTGALVSTAVVLAVISLGAHAEDRRLSAGVEKNELRAAPNWVDRSGGVDVLLVEPTGNNAGSAMLLALRNRSVDGIALLGRKATAFDGAVRRLTVDDRGTLRLGVKPVEGQLLLDGTSTRILVANSRTIAKGGDFALVDSARGARLSTIVEGMYSDGWLAGSGSVTLFATGRSGICRNATLRLTLPAGGSPVRVFLGGQIRDVEPGSTSRIFLSGDPSGRTTVHFTSTGRHLLATPSLRTVSVHAQLADGVGPCEMASL